jgi:nucleotide-binding universal stress UspA family protein
MVDTILLATDGSEHAQRATAHALALAKREQAMLEAIFVVDTRELGEPALSSVEILIDEYEDRGREVLREVSEAAEKHDITVEMRCCHGVPSQEILALADAVDADLIVIGERGETHRIKEGEVARALRRADDRVIVA